MYSLTAIIYKYKKVYVDDNITLIGADKINHY